MCVVPTGLQRWSADRSLAVVGVIRPEERAARRPLVLVCGGPCARAPERRLEAVDAVCSGASATRRPYVLVCRGPPAESVRVALRGESALSVLAALMAQAPNPGPWGEAGDPECRRAGGLDGPARRALGAAAGSLFRGWVRFALLLEEILSRSRGISALAFPLPSARFQLDSVCAFQAQGIRPHRPRSFFRREVFQLHQPRKLHQQKNHEGHSVHPPAEVAGGRLP